MFKTLYINLFGLCYFFSWGQYQTNTFHLNLTEQNFILENHSPSQTLITKVSNHCFKTKIMTTYNVCIFIERTFIFMLIKLYKYPVIFVNIFQNEGRWSFQMHFLYWIFHFKATCHFISSIINSVHILYSLMVMTKSKWDQEKFIITICLER